MLGTMSATMLLRRFSAVLVAPQNCQSVARVSSSTQRQRESGTNNDRVKGALPHSI